jgi:hypothetical protein
MDETTEGSGGDLRDLYRAVDALAQASCENRWRWADGDCLDHDESPPCWRCGARSVLAASEGGD